MADKIFSDADTIRDLVQIAKLPDHAKAACMTALVRRGFPARLFGGEMKDGSPFIAELRDLNEKRCSDVAVPDCCDSLSPSGAAF